jgi:hydroxypyruvate isomerase
MIRFSANISTLFLERPELERPQAARDAGFTAVEIQFPYEHSAQAWKAALDAAGVELALINLPVGDMMSGGPGLASVPGREAMFADALAQAADYARVLRPRNVNVLAGWPGAAFEREACLATLASNLNMAAETMSRLGIGVVVEAVNTVDRPGYLISTTAQAIDVIDRAGHKNLGIQYDLYHMQIMEGDLIRTLQTFHDRIGHIQFADNPGRNEPGTGEIHFANVFAALAKLPYAGYVGAEYTSSKRTEETLGWMV